MKKEEKKVKQTDTKNNTKKREKYIAEKKVVKNKKRINVFKSIARYFNGVIKEIKRIKWTSGKDLVKYSIASIILIIFFGLYFYGINWIVLLVRSLAN